MADLPQGFYPEPQPETPAEPTDDVTIVVGAEGDVQPAIDPQTGAVTIEMPDGSLSIDLNPQPKPKGVPTDFNANLAEFIAADERSRIAEELLRAIEADDQSRQDWLQTRAKGIEMLGFKLEEPRGDSGTASAPVEGMSTVRHPLLAEAVIRFQSNAAAELLPAGGPVKVRNDEPQAPPGAPGVGHNGGPPLDDDPNLAGLTKDDLASSLEKDFNHYLTATDKGYRPDTDRMLFWVGFGGCAFKKVYHDPIRRMPVSRSVDAKDLIVANTANDLDDCGRITHQIRMRRSQLVRMQIAGVYRAVPNLIGMEPQQQPNAVDQKTAQVQGFAPTPQRPEDGEFTIYESYVELDIRGFEHKDEKGNPTGLELPYKVTIEKETRGILEIRRNWKEDDPNCLPKKIFVKYPFIPCFGFYEIGLLQMLGNSTKALTGAWRMALDAGMFASFPGFLYSDAMGRQQTNEFRIPPGGGQKIQTGQKDIRAVVMPVPYHDATPGLAAVAKEVEQTGQRLGGTAELQVGEGRQDAPVGTTLALIEQATKMLAAIHIRLHAAQSEEFQALKERFKEDPEAFWRHNKKPARPWRADELIAALEDTDLVPAADPNTASHMQRIMKAVAVKQLQGMNPQLYDAKAVDERILREIGVADPEALFAPPQPAGPPPMPPEAQAKLAELSLKKQNDAATLAAKQQEAAAKVAQTQQQQEMQAKEVAVESADRAADRESRERVAAMRENTERLKLAGTLAQHGVPVDTGTLAQGQPGLNSAPVGQPRPI